MPCDRIIARRVYQVIVTRPLVEEVLSTTLATRICLEGAVNARRSALVKSEPVTTAMTRNLRRRGHSPGRIVNTAGQVCRRLQKKSPSPSLPFRRIAGTA